MNECTMLVEFADTAAGLHVFLTHEESISYSIQVAAMAALVILLVRMLLYYWRCCLICKDNESYNKLYDALILGLNSLKVVLVTFPRSVIAVLFVIPCHKYKDWTSAVFNTIWGASFIFFWVSLLYYQFKYPCNGNNESELRKARIRAVVMFAIPVILSIVGFSFEVAFCVEFLKRCYPHLFN